jgi:hypothetical protein
MRLFKSFLLIFLLFFSTYRIFAQLGSSPTDTVTISGTPVLGQTLSVSNTLSDPDGLGTITDQWYPDGHPIVYGGTLKDGVNGVDGLDETFCVTLSPEGNHALVTATVDDSVGCFFTDKEHKGFCFLITAKIAG